MGSVKCEEETRHGLIVVCVSRTPYRNLMSAQKKKQETKQKTNNKVKNNNALLKILLSDFLLKLNALALIIPINSLNSSLK